MKPKIAICLTGQIRTYNQEGHFKDMHEGLQEAFGGWSDYVLFGHTWKDQPEIKDPEKFRMLYRTNQKLIWQNLAEIDPFTPMLMTDKIKKSQKYQDMFLHGTDTGIREWMRDITIGIYSQIVSSWHCINGVNNSYRDWDAVVKFRWDGGIDTVSQRWIDEVQDFINGKVTSSPAVLVQYNDDTTVPDPVIHDVMFIFNKKGFQQLVGPNKLEIYLQIAEMGKLGLLTNHTHELWEDYFKYNRINIESLSIDAKAHIGFDSFGPGDPNLKTNKKWGL